MLIVATDLGYGDGLTGELSIPELFNEPARTLYLRAYEAGTKARLAEIQAKEPSGGSSDVQS